MTIHPVSRDDNPGDGSDFVASFTWVAAGLAVPPAEQCVECGFGNDEADKVSALTLEYMGYTLEPPFVAYGTPTGNIPDPVARALDGLLDEVQSLRARVNELEGGRGRGGESGNGDLPLEGDAREAGTEGRDEGQALGGKC